MIQIKKNNEIYEIEIRETLGTTDPKEAKEIMNKIYDLKIQYGNLKQLRTETNNQKGIEHAKKLKKVLDSLGEAMDTEKVMEDF